MCRPTGRRGLREGSGLGPGDGGRNRLAAWARRLLRSPRRRCPRRPRCSWRAFPLMRGVRMQLHWHENPMYRFAPRPDLMNDERFRRNLAYLERLRLELRSPGLCEPDGAMPRHSPTTIRAPPSCLQHAGMLEDLSDEGRAQWREGMRLLARESNIVSKMSGLGTFIHANDEGPHRRASIAIRLRSSARRAVSSARISRSRNCGRPIRAHATPTRRPQRSSAPPNSAISSGTLRPASIASPT